MEMIIKIFNSIKTHIKTNKKIENDYHLLTRLGMTWSNVSVLKRLILTLFFMALTPVTFAQSQTYIEDDSFDPSAIGQRITYEEKLIYLVLDDSPEGFLENNVGISRMLATSSQAKGNDIHVKEVVPDGMTFTITAIYKPVIDTQELSEDARILYLDFMSQNPGLGYNFVLIDESGVQSTVGIANLKKSSYEIKDQ